MPFRVAAVQLRSGPNRSENLSKIEDLILRSADGGASLVSLPEFAPCLAPLRERPEYAEKIPGPSTDFLSDLARKFGLYIHCGSVIERSVYPAKVYNTSVFINPKGEIIAIYRKIHLFDVELEGGKNEESRVTIAGNEPVVVTTELATFGFTICYDLRFPELFRSITLLGAQIIFVPAAFLLATGKDHWEPLLRSRAIENQVYIIAAAQVGTPFPGLTHYGNSMIIDPWGTVLARAPEEETVIFASVDLQRIERVRREVPCLANRRPEAYKGLSS